MNGHRYAATLMKALAHPVRLQILEVLQQEDEACVCHLEQRLGQRQAYISQQLAKLRDAGLVTDRRDGLNVFYAIVPAHIAPLIDETKRLAKALAHNQGLALAFASIQEVPPDQCNCPKCGQKVVERHAQA